MHTQAAFAHANTQAVEEFSADATRWALADAGDGMDDANFETTIANAAILRITKELVFIEEALAPQSGGGEVEGKSQNSSAHFSLASSLSKHLKMSRGIFDVDRPLQCSALLSAKTKQLVLAADSAKAKRAIASFSLLFGTVFPDPFQTLSSSHCLTGLRDGEPTALFDRSFDNAINIAIAQAKADILCRQPWQWKDTLNSMNLKGVEAWTSLHGGFPAQGKSLAPQVYKRTQMWILRTCTGSVRPPDVQGGRKGGRLRLGQCPRCVQVWRQALALLELSGLAAFCS
eukprot:1137333-Pelagomonas_calceolata.AAC.4